MRDRRRTLTASCLLALVALGLMIWSLFDPRPIPVVVAMSVGQAIGTLSLISFLYVVVAEWRESVATDKGPPLASKS